MKNIAVGFGVLVGVLCTSFSKGQLNVIGEKYNPIKIGTPFLTIAPDARGASMGDQGVAGFADNNSQYWNPSKYVFANTKGGASYTFTPWLSNINSGMSLHYLAGFYKIDEMQAVSGSLRYFAIGSTEFTDNNNSVLKQYSPNELAFDLGYSRKLTDELSSAIAFRYIKSDVTGGGELNSISSKAASTFAADISIFYTKSIYAGYNQAEYAFGLNLSNIGPKISYSDNKESKAYLPTNLRIGGRYTTEVQREHKISFLLELSKLLVPTPDYDSLGIDKNADKSVISGIFSSFGDAPNGFSEELQEFTLAVGGEYSFQDMFSARAGFFNESKNKGNRKYFTVGLGVKYKMMILDLSYLVPTVNAANNPLTNTFRVTVGANLGEDKYSKSGRRSSYRRRR